MGNGILIAFMVSSDFLGGMLLLGTFLFLLIGSAMLIFNLLPDFQKLNMSKKFTDELGAGRKPPGLINLFRLPILMFSELAVDLKMVGRRERYQRDLQRLGLEKVVTVDQLMALWLTIFVISLIYSVLLTVVMPLFFCLFIPFFGWIYVDIWLKDKIKQRKKQIKMQLPFVLDMLTLSVEAGLEFTAAINKIVAKLEPTALREELTIFLRQMQLGMSRRDALKAMAERSDLPQMNSMVSALIQASEMGASVGSALRTQTEIMNAERFTDAEKKGAEASQKMLLPMVIFIVPAVLLVIVGPLLVQFVYHSGGL
ncbi:MAG TPA: type II secretion system F family protein [Thermoanaerobaculia bacterium]|nr:type II secretion system F family protein [Thermoanaerobaculia bacterium]